MFRHLLLPLDGSGLAESVLPYAEALARRLGADLTLLHVLEKDAPSRIHGDHHLTQLPEAAAYLERLSEGLRHGGLAVRWHAHEVAVGNVARSITEHAAEMGTDLIVLATHGQGGVRSMVFGSIAQRVIGHGATPVLILHPDEGVPPFSCRRIMVPLDGAADHAAAVPVALGLARQFEAAVHLLSAVPRRGNLGGPQAAVGRVLPSATAAYLELREEEAGHALQELTAPFAETGVPASWSVVRGDPVDAILAGLHEHQSDLLVLATHARRGWSAFWSGSVGPALLAQWHRPTLLLRAGAR